MASRQQLGRNKPDSETCILIFSNLLPHNLACPVGPRDRLRGLRPRPHWLSDQLGQWVGADLLESCERLDSSHLALDLHQQPNGAFKARPWESP